jgi:hypothetical protein
MIQDSILNTKLAEPAIGEVHLHFMADQPLRADRNTYPTASIQMISSGSIDGDLSTKNKVLVRCEARTDRAQHLSSAPCDLGESRRQDGTRKTVDLRHSSDGPSWIDLVENRINTTESRFAVALN